MECFNQLKGVLNGEELTELQKEIDKLQDKKQKPAAKKSDCVFGAVVSLSGVYITPKLLHGPRTGPEIKIRNNGKRKSSGSSPRHEKIRLQIQNFDVTNDASSEKQSSGELDFSVPLLTMKNDAASGDDIFSFLLSELDISHDSDYLGCLMRCLSVLLNFSSDSLFFLLTQTSSTK